MVSVDARRVVLLARSKKVLTALLVAKRRRAGDSEDAIRQLIDDVHPEEKRQIAERVLGMVSFPNSSTRIMLTASSLDSRYLFARPPRGKQRDRWIAFNRRPRKRGSP